MAGPDLRRRQRRLPVDDHALERLRHHHHQAAARKALGGLPEPMGGFQAGSGGGTPVSAVLSLPCGPQARLIFHGGKGGSETPPEPFKATYPPAGPVTAVFWSSACLSAGVAANRRRCARLSGDSASRTHGAIMNSAGSFRGSWPTAMISQSAFAVFHRACLLPG